MTTVAKTKDGKWMMTFEWWWGKDDNVQYKIADDPLHFYQSPKKNISQLRGGLSLGGSPVMITLPDRRIAYNAASSGDIFVNESGMSNGNWTRFKTPVSGGYSRNLQYASQTGRIVILQGLFGGAPIRHGETDIGNSAGAYYQLVNKKTGQVLGTGGKTQDAAYSGDNPDIVVEPADSSGHNNTQYWHLTKKNGDFITVLNKTGGRAVAVWQGNIAVGSKLAQWVDDNAKDKLWKVATEKDGYITLSSASHSGLLATGGETNGSVKLDSPRNDGSQEWKMVRDPSQTGYADRLDEVETTIGTEPVLPSVVTVTYSGRSSEYDDGSIVPDAQIKWDHICVNSYSKLGFFTVNGIANGDVKVTVKVQVKPDSARNDVRADGSRSTMLAETGASVSGIFFALAAVLFVYFVSWRLNNWYFSK